MFKHFCLGATLLLLLDSSFANTEIVNFSAAEDYSVDLPFTQTWPIFHPESSSTRLNVTSAKLGTVIPQEICPDLDKWRPERQHWCPHEHWVVLDLDQGQWRHFDRFTLRISWAAFNPTDFSIKVYNPTALDAFSDRTHSAISSKTRRKYARIQLVHTGVLTPPVNDTLDAILRHEVPFILTLEPLHLGIIPSSVIPVIGAILVAIVLGLPLSGRINSYLHSIVEQVNTKKKKS
ncbi:hypothetical protein CVT25_002633 [Psilocybe cyanescens]|uniref:Uncharacterized protein n=1 Tax=Psilocybe cyanescens TaxID=93625 RepID=A0A409WLD0_PSICY|nr:hypothetical protein CVT25_002633 [Psilocybe cyanescens]